MLVKKKTQEETNNTKADTSSNEAQLGQNNNQTKNLSNPNA